MKTAAFILTILLSSICEAQNTIPKNELGLNLYGNELIYSNLTSYRGINNYYFSGIQFKRNFSKNYAIRASFQKGSFQEVFSDAWNYRTSSGAINLNIYENKIGIEKGFRKGKLKPFLLFDFVHRYENEVFRTTSVNLSNDLFVNNYEINSHYLGFNLGVGLKYYLNNALYISAESSVGYNFRLFEGPVNWYENGFINPIKTVTFGVRF
jgi:hypothetical protein